MNYKYILNKILVSWNELIQLHQLNYDPENSEEFLFAFRNDKIILHVKVEKYLDKFDVFLIDPNKKINYPISVFKILEFLKGENSKIYPFLKETKSKLSINKYFFQRYFLDTSSKENWSFSEHLNLFQILLLIELKEILEGNFNFFKSFSSYITNYYKIGDESLKEKNLAEEDFKTFYHSPFKYPIEKVAEEIVFDIDNFSEFTKYEISSDEKTWLRTLEGLNKSFGTPLPKKYIESFESKFKVELPRDYKLFLNYIGNGYYRFRSLEQSICNSPLNLESECFKFIDLTKSFQVEKQSQRNSGTGFLRIYDFGCGIIHYLIVKGEHKGKIWYQNPEFGDMIEIDENYDSWISSFRIFLVNIVLI